MRFKLKPLSQQTLVITGASSGIGLATAREAVRRGARVVLVARNASVLETIAEELGSAAAPCALDIADEGSASRIADAAEREFGGFDTWVNCAAVSDYGTLQQIGIDEHRRVFEVNYFAMLQACLVAVDRLRRRGEPGAIINVGSVLSDRTIIQQGPYSASKHAVRSLTEALRMDIEREGLPVSVTLIKPNGIHTPFPEHARNHMDLPPRVPQVIYGPELAADAILFAAQRPRRQIYVGGQGFALSVLARLFPRSTDRMMEAFFVRAQQSATDAGDPAMRDNLYEPRRDGQVEGNQDFYVRRHSLAVEAQKHPLAAGALIAGTAAAGAMLWNWRQRNRRPQYERT